MSVLRNRPAANYLMPPRIVERLVAALGRSERTIRSVEAALIGSDDLRVNFTPALVLELEEDFEP